MTTTCRVTSSSRCSNRTTAFVVLLLIAVSGVTSSFTVPTRLIGTRRRSHSFCALRYQKTTLDNTKEKRALSVRNAAYVNATNDFDSDMMKLNMYAPSTLEGSDSSSSPLLKKNAPEEEEEDSFWAPRLLLAAVACLYGTNFCLGSVMNDALPASAATSARMVLAGLALSPFLTKLKPSFRVPALIAGLSTSMGYVTQSLSLVDTSPATVSFLGATIVLICPALQCIIDKKKLGWKDAPQTWIAAILCLMGVGVLELCGSTIADVTITQGNMMHMGHVLALLQAVGFGGGLYLSSRMVQEEPDQALPVTANMVSMTALVSMIWSLADGWLYLPGGHDMALPNVLLHQNWQVAAAVLWTGLLSTSLNFYLEVSCLSKVPSSEASVILATEPLWAALFASLLLKQELGWNDMVGGVLIVAACLANTLEPQQVHDKLRVFGEKEGKK